MLPSASFALGFLLVGGGCASGARSKAPDATPPAAPFPPIELADGVDATEARSIAQRFFESPVNGNLCGLVEVPIDENTRWRVPIEEGYFPVPTKDVLIDKRTGDYVVKSKAGRILYQGSAALPPRAKESLRPGPGP